jgi:single-strand DNA-binding protein
MNKVMLVGNLGGDPEGTSLRGGSYVVNVNLATTRRWKDAKSGEKQEETSWHRLVVWGSLAEIFEQYLTKGSRIAVTGRIQYRSWEDKESGKKLYGTDIVVEEMEMLGGGEERSDDRGRGQDRGRSRDRGRGEDRGNSRDRGGRDRQRSNSGRATGRGRDEDDSRSSRSRRDEPEDRLDPEEEDIPF